MWLARGYATLLKALATQIDRTDLPMNDETFHVLLEKLGAGDSDAASELFRTYEPYLRVVVRRNLSNRLRSKFDSMDIVQSVWADLLEGFRSGSWHFADSNHFRAFLIRATRNRFLNRLRRNRQAIKCELPLGDKVAEVAAANPQPCEHIQADDMWQKMIILCPPAHRELLQLRRQGASLSELAEHSGLHESSIRRILSRSKCS